MGVVSDEILKLVTTRFHASLEVNSIWHTTVPLVDRTADRSVEVIDVDDGQWITALTRDDASRKPHSDALLLRSFRIQEPLGSRESMTQGNEAQYIDSFGVNLGLERRGQDRVTSKRAVGGPRVALRPVFDVLIRLGSNFVHDGIYLIIIVRAFPFGLSSPSAGDQLVVICTYRVCCLFCCSHQYIMCTLFLACPLF